MVNVLDDKALLKENINLDLAVSKGLVTGDDYNVYLKVQGLYRKAFDFYLLLNTRIRDYDKEVKNSSLYIGVMPKDRLNVYHKISNLGLDYLYVCNFFNIEKLNDGDLDTLKNKILENDFKVDSILLSVVEKTFKDVINDNFRKGEYKDSAMKCYGSVVPSNFVGSDVLVIALHYGKNTIQMDKDEFMSNLVAKEEFLNHLCESMTKEFSNKLNVSVKVLVRSYVD